MVGNLLQAGVLEFDDEDFCWRCDMSGVCLFVLLYFGYVGVVEMKIFFCLI